MNLIEGSKKNRITSIALVLSLALNLLLVGMIAGRFMMHSPPRPLPSGLEWLLSGMPVETRHKFRSEVAKHREESRSLRREMFEAQRKFNQMLAEESLDATSLRESLDRIRETRARFQSAVHEQMIPLLIELDADDRKKAFRALRRDRRPSPHLPSVENPRRENWD